MKIVVNVIIIIKFNFFIIILFIQLFMYVQNVSNKGTVLNSCHHKLSVMHVHGNEKELITVQCILLQSLKQITTLNFNTETNRTYKGVTA